MQRPTSYLLAVVHFGAVLLCAAAHADDDGIVTDRPDFVESSDVVGRGRMQLETGINLERNTNSGAEDRVYTTPTLIRAGLNDHWELRMETDGRTVASTTVGGVTDTVHGYSDIALGVKWRFTDAKGGLPSTAWLLHVDMDTGSAAFRGNGLRPSLRFVAEWDLPNDTSLGIMPGVIYDKNDEHRFVSGIMAATVGKQFTPKFRGFVELAGQQLASKADGGTVVTADAGMTYLVSKLIQLDVSVSRGLTDETPDWSGGIGFSMKF